MNFPAVLARGCQDFTRLGKHLVLLLCCHTCLKVLVQGKTRALLKNPQAFRLMTLGKEILPLSKT